MTAPTARHRLKLATSRLVWGVLGAVLTAAIWQLAAALLGPYRLPPLEAILPQVFPLLHESNLLEFQGGGSAGLLPHLRHTIVFTLVGSAIGVAAGIGAGVAMARWGTVRAIVERPIDVLRTIPPLAAIPFFLIWIGTTAFGQVMMVAFYAFVMMVVTTLNAAANVDPIYLRFAATLGADQNRIFRTVVWPAMTPTIAGGVRVAVGIAFGVQVVAELMGGREGMGQVFSMMISFQALDVIIVGIFWIAVAAVIVDLLLVWFSRRVTRWAP
ncbi:MAG TPA: ABC transporter permease subunit, partial [Thermomicrobiales bacterium]|nr:ABC transporter permease subunit [Thermomicrobiales bacterium]